MADDEVDYVEVFRCSHSPAALLSPDLTFLDVNNAFVALSKHRREDLVGGNIFGAFPENPTGVNADSIRYLRASLRRVLETGESDVVALLKFDYRPDGSGQFEQRYWGSVNSPVLGPDGSATMIIFCVEEITDLILSAGALDRERKQTLEIELLQRSREMQKLNERLRQAHERERNVTLALQEAMLPAPIRIDHAEAAVRYLPSTQSLNVCGDWYDLVQLPDERIAVAVGDVVGHGLSAAGVMGQLRSALSAAVRFADGPDQALEELDLYARSVAGAESTTAVQVIVDCATRTISYSSAGHPPPVLVSADGAVELLDQATDPPLGACPDCDARPRAHLPFTDDSTLVLYTDGLIERRREDIDVGLARLADSVARHRALPPEVLANALLADLGVSVNTMDDTALIVMRLGPRVCQA